MKVWGKFKIVMMSIVLLSAGHLIGFYQGKNAVKNKLENIHKITVVDCSGGVDFPNAKPLDQRPYIVEL